MSTNPKLQPTGQIGTGRITQRAMLNFLELEANYKVIETRYKDECERLLHLIAQGAEQEDGRYVAVDDQKEYRRPAWKEEFIRVTSEEEAKEVSRNCKPGVSHKFKIVHRTTIQDILPGLGGR